MTQDSNDSDDEDEWTTTATNQMKWLRTMTQDSNDSDDEDEWTTANQIKWL